MQQAVFLSGPLLVAAVTAAARAAVALACSAVPVGAGTVAFVAAASTAAPARRPHRDQWMLGAWRVPAVRTWPECSWPRSRPTAFWARSARGPRPVGGATPPRAGGFAAALIPVAALSSQPSAAALVAIGATLSVAGLFVTPLAATSYMLIEKTTAPDHRTEALAWLSTSQATGNAAGAALAGTLTGSAGPAISLAILPIAIGLTTLIARSRLPPHPDDQRGPGDQGGTRLLC
jgi:hypothetical protein